MLLAAQALEGLVEEEALGSYVLVEKEDVLDAIGTFVAAYLAIVPEAQHMKPAELQQALTSTFRVCCSFDLQSCCILRMHNSWHWPAANKRDVVQCSVVSSGLV